MKPKSNPIIFFGTDNFSLHALSGLVKAGYTVSALVTKPDSKQGRGQKITFPEVKSFALENNIKVLQPQSLSEINDFIKSLDSPLGILSSYGKIIPEKTINLFTPGIINVHPSLLPKYRGASPIESAILNGDLITGVSIMKLLPGLDDGPVYAQEVYRLNGQETGPSLTSNLAAIGTNLLLKTLPNIINGSLTPVDQNHDEASFTERIPKEASQLNPSLVTAKQAEQKVRAHLGFPKTKFTFNDLTVIITKSHVSSQPSGLVDIVCADNNYLIVDELISPNGRKMSSADFKNGYLRSS